MDGRGPLTGVAAGQGPSGGGGGGGDPNQRGKGGGFSGPLPLATRATRLAADSVDGGCKDSKLQQEVVRTFRAASRQRGGVGSGERVVVRRRQQGRPAGGRQRAQPGRQG